MKGHCNSYGFLGILSAIAAGVAWSLVKSKDEKCMVSGFNELQWYHDVGVIAGIVLCVCAVFGIAALLNNMTPVLLYVAGICIGICGGVMGYAAFFVFSRPCMPALGFIPLHIAGGSNIFQAKDGQMIAVFILDILACIMFLSAGANVARRAV